jgi:hypothetical protein
LMRRLVENDKRRGVSASNPDIKGGMLRTRIF